MSLLCGWVQGQISRGVESGFVQGHVRGCRNCAAFAESLAQLDHDLRASFVSLPRTEVGPEQIFARVDQEMARPIAGRTMRWQPVAAGFVVLVASGLAIKFMQGKPREVAGSSIFVTRTNEPKHDSSTLVLPSKNAVEAKSKVVGDLAYCSQQDYRDYISRTKFLLDVSLENDPGKGGYIQIPPALTASSDGSLPADPAERRKELAVVDPRLGTRLTLSEKRITFQQLCLLLTRKTGVRFDAEQPVADSKLTLYCTRRPLRDLMRQINQVFGFAWERTGEPGAWKYELKHPVQLQIYEAALRDTNFKQVALGLEKELRTYQEFLALDPLAARERALLASGANRIRLKVLGGPAWGAIRLYPRLDVEDRQLLWEGKKIYLRPSHEEGFPDDFRKPILNSLDSGSKDDGVVVGFQLQYDAAANRYVLLGGAGVTRNGVTFAERYQAIASAPASKKTSTKLDASLKGRTSADVLESIHKSTGKDVLGDYYTRVFEPTKVSKQESDGWLVFRSTDYFNLNAQEPRDELLSKWAKKRAKNRALELDDLTEMARLPDEQLNSRSVGSAVPTLYGLPEWKYMATGDTRFVWRLVDELSTGQRSLLVRESGVAFGQMSGEGQRLFVRLAVGYDADVDLLAWRNASIRLVVSSGAYRPNDRFKFIIVYPRSGGLMETRILGDVR